MALPVILNDHIPLILARIQLLDAEREGYIQFRISELEKPAALHLQLIDDALCEAFINLNLVCVAGFIQPDLAGSAPHFLARQALIPFAPKTLAWVQVGCDHVFEILQLHLVFELLLVLVARLARVYRVAGVSFRASFSYPCLFFL